MPRQRSFDEDVVLTAAMKCFWRRGYCGTSMKDLEAATGLTTGSLYNGFESKDELFRLALLHYVDSVVRARVARYLMGGNARDGIVGFVRDGVHRGSSGRLSFGCFLVNTFAEAPLHRREVLPILIDGQRIIDDGLLAAVKRGLAAGAFKSDLAPETLARQLSLATTALLLRSRADQKAGWYAESVRAFEALLPVA